MRIQKKIDDRKAYRLRKINPDHFLSEIAEKFIEKQAIFYDFTPMMAGLI